MFDATQPPQWGGRARDGARPRIITQGVLEQFAEYKRIAKQHDDLRQHLRQLLERGAEVEPGRLSLGLRVSEQRRLTQAALLPLLGPDVVEDLKRRVTPTVYRQLILTESRSGRDS